MDITYTSHVSLMIVLDHIWAYDISFSLKYRVERFETAQWITRDALMGGSGLISATWGSLTCVLHGYHIICLHMIMWSYILGGTATDWKNPVCPTYPVSIILCILKTCMFQYKPIWSDTIMVRGIWIFLMRARLRRISVFFSYRLGADIRACVIFSLVLAYSLRDAVMDAQDKFKSSSITLPTFNSNNASHFAFHLCGNAAVGTGNRTNDHVRSSTTPQPMSRRVGSASLAALLQDPWSYNMKIRNYPAWSYIL